MSDPVIHIVIVEDEKHIRQFLRMTLQAEGILVTEAATAKEGVAKISMQKPDLVILDLGLPDRDGIEVIRQLRRSEEHTSELQSLMRISYAVFCLKKKRITNRMIKKSIRSQPINHITTHVKI